MLRNELRVWLVLGLAVAFVLPHALRGQQASAPAQGQTLPPAQSAPIAVSVKVVNMLATVRDKHDKIVSTLGKDDFVLTEDGKPEQITYFSRDTDVPLTLGLLVDTSGSQRTVLDDERTASHGFLVDMLQNEKDQAFVIHFDEQVELLQDLTSSHDKLATALELLQTPRPQFSQPNGNADPNGSGSPNSNGGQTGNGGSNGGNTGNGGPGGGGYGRRAGGQGFSGRGTMLYDAIFLASDEVIKKQQGRKALIVLSDGVDHGSKETLETAIMTAQRADTVVYSILFTGEQQSQGPFGGGGGGGGFGGRGMGRHGGGGQFPQEDRPDGKKVLERISKETGGRLFEVTKKEPIDQIYSSIEEDLRNQYSIGYTPATNVEPGYHKLQLTVKQKDMTVQARAGYYADR